MSHIWSALKRNLIAGALVVLPAGATLFLIFFLWSLIERPLYRFFRLFDRPPETLGDGYAESMAAWLLRHNVDLSAVPTIPGVGIIIILACIYLIGMLARSLAGRSLIGYGEALVHRLPIVGTVYGALKQIVEAILSDQSQAFREAVMVEYPRKGIWTVAFVTNRVEPGRLPELPDVGGMRGKKLILFVPTTPNPTSGYIILVDEDDVLPLDMNTDDALKFVISGGIVLPSRARLTRLAERRVPPLEGASPDDTSDPSPPERPEGTPR